MEKKDRKSAGGGRVIFDEREASFIIFQVALRLVVRASILSSEYLYTDTCWFYETLSTIFPNFVIFLRFSIYCSTIHIVYVYIYIYIYAMIKKIFFFSLSRETSKNYRIYERSSIGLHQIHIRRLRNCDISNIYTDTRSRVTIIITLFAVKS